MIDKGMKLPKLIVEEIKGVKVIGTPTQIESLKKYYEEVKVI